MGSFQMPEAWLVSRDKPILTAPSGRTFRMCGSRGQAVHVLRAAIGVIATEDATLPATLASAYPKLQSMFLDFAEVARAQGEEHFGQSLAQYLDVIAWELTWADAGVEVRHG